MQTVITDLAPKAVGPYSQAKISGNLLFASGIVAIDPQSSQIVGTSIKEQAMQCMKNIGGLLKSQNLGYENIIKTTCFLHNIEDFKAFNEVYAQYFTSDAPARSCVGGLDLPLNLLCEIEFIAELKS